MSTFNFCCRATCINNAGRVFQYMPARRTVLIIISIIIRYSNNYNKYKNQNAQKIARSAMMCQMYEKGIVILMKSYAIYNT